MEEIKDPRLEYELTYCEVEHERDMWMAAKAKAERAAGLDSNLNGLLEMRTMRMNYLLEELFERMGALATQEVV